MTVTDTRRRTNSANGARPPVPTQDRPFTFHGLTPSFTLTRGNSNSHSSLASIDLPTAPVSPTKEPRERRLSFRAQSATPTGPDRPNSALGKRPSVRLGSFLSRFNQDPKARLSGSRTPVPSPLGFKAVYEDNDGLVDSERPIRSAMRGGSRFSMGDHSDSDADHRLQIMSQQHWRTSEGSLVEVLATSRVLYAENADETEAEHKPDPKTPVLCQHPSESDTALSVEAPSLSRSSSGANTGEDPTPLTPPAHTSPCSTLLRDESLHTVLGETNTPSDRDASMFLLVAAHMLSTHAAAFYRHAETMTEVSRTMRTMADESLEWGTRLMSMADGRVASQDMSAALGLMNVSPPNESSIPPPIGARPSRPLTPDPPSNVDSLPMQRQLSLPVTTSGPSPTLPPVPPLPTLPAALVEAERLGRVGWANLRNAEEVWSQAMSELRAMAGENKPKVDQVEPSTPPRSPPSSPRMQLGSPFQPRSSHASSRPASRPISHPVSPRSTAPPSPTALSESSRRPSLASMIAAGMELMQSALEDDSPPASPTPNLLPHIPERPVTPVQEVSTWASGIVSGMLAQSTDSLPSQLSAEVSPKSAETDEWMALSIPGDVKGDVSNREEAKEETLAEPQPAPEGIPRERRTQSDSQVLSPENRKPWASASEDTIRPERDDGSKITRKLSVRAFERRSSSQSASTAATQRTSSSSPKKRWFSLKWATGQKSP